MKKRRFKTCEFFWRKLSARCWHPHGSAATLTNHRACAQLFYPMAANAKKAVRNRCVFLSKAVREVLAHARERRDPHDPSRLRTTFFSHVQCWEGRGRSSDTYTINLEDFGIHPRCPVSPLSPVSQLSPRIPAIRCHQPQVGTPLPHAPGAMMT